MEVEYCAFAETSLDFCRIRHIATKKLLRRSGSHLDFLMKAGLAMSKIRLCQSPWNCKVLVTGLPSRPHRSFSENTSLFISQVRKFRSILPLLLNQLSFHQKEMGIRSFDLKASKHLFLGDFCLSKVCCDSIRLRLLGMRYYLDDSFFDQC